MPFTNATARRLGLGSVSWPVNNSTLGSGFALVQLRGRRKVFITDIIVGTIPPPVWNSLNAQTFLAYRLAAFRVCAFVGLLESDPDNGSSLDNLYPSGVDKSSMKFENYLAGETYSEHFKFDAESFVVQEGEPLCVLAFNPFFVVDNKDAGATLHKVGEIQAGASPFSLSVLGVEC